MPIRAYMDVFTACFELNTILHSHKQSQIIEILVDSLLPRALVN